MRNVDTSVRLILTLLVALILVSIASAIHQETDHPIPVSNPGHSFDDLGGGDLRIRSGASLIFESGSILKFLPGGAGKVFTSTNATGVISLQPVPGSVLTGGSCAVGKAVSKINPDGTVQCISIGSFTGGSCQPGQALKEIRSDGSFICSPKGSFTGGSCVGKVVTAINSSGVITCANKLTGGSCPSGQAVNSVNSNGTVSCVAGIGDNLGNHIATGILFMNNFRVTDVANPTQAQDAATKGYADSTLQVKFSGSCTNGVRVINASTGVFSTCGPAASSGCKMHSVTYSSGYKCRVTNGCFFNNPSGILRCNSNGTWTATQETNPSSSCLSYSVCAIS